MKAILFWSLLLPVAYIHACTGIKLVAKDGTVSHGRTVEFGVSFPATVVVVPRGQQFTGTTSLGPGMKYQNKYGFVGCIAYSALSILDGMNEMGLSVGTFYFPTCASYTTVTAQNQPMALSPIDFPNWVLSQCATIADVKAKLSQVVVVSIMDPNWGPAPFHYVVYDKDGNSLVIEPTGGRLVTFDNPLGVITNSPSFDWHMTNLRNFINLNTNPVPPMVLNGVTFPQLGMGPGMLGLPGDFTPPSRFVRAAIFSATAIQPANAPAAVFQIFHILNQFDVPVGLNKSVMGGQTVYDFTMLTTVKDPQSLRYYFRGYDDQSIRYVDLTKFDMNASAIKKAATASTQTAQDISSTLQ